MTKSQVVQSLADGVGCLAKSHPEEPVFVLVGRDAFAARHVRDWADAVENWAARNGELTGKRQEKVAAARRIALAMDVWQSTHGSRVPE